MKRTIRYVSLEELDEVMEVVSRAVQWMNGHGSIQWNQNYPAEADFRLDIDNRALLGIYEGQALYGVCAIDQKAYPEYDVVQWKNVQTPVFYLHRVAVDPKKHGQGLASELIRYAVLYAKRKGAHALRTDTTEKNIPMRRTFEKLGFICMEPMFLLTHNLAMGACVAYEKTWIEKE